MEENQEIIEKPKRKRIQGKRVLINEYFPSYDKIEIPEPLVLQIGKIADELNVKAYIVGGYVRDYFLKRERTDFDFTVVGDSISFAEEVAKRLNSTAIVYPRFRTAMVPYQNMQIEFVGTRKEVYLTGTRNPIVSEGTLEDDLKRRDFTINTLAASINSETMGVVTDLYQGRTDLQSKILRTPLNPATTFNDDPLRMMRAARFASQLGFKIQPECLEAISELNERITIISQERITAEFLKILQSPIPSVGINILHETGLLKIIFPEVYNLTGIEVKEIKGISYGHKDIYIHTLQVVDKVAEQSQNVWLRFAALVHDIAKPRTKKYIDLIGWTFYGHEDIGSKMLDSIFRRLKLPLDNLDYIKRLVKLHQRPMSLVDDGITDSAIRRLAFQAGDALEDLFLLCRADITTNNPDKSQKYFNNYDTVAKKVIEVQEKDKLREFQSPVRGDEIMKICKLKPSKEVGIIKLFIEEAILDGIIPNEYEAARKYFMKNKKKWIKEIYSNIPEDKEK